MSLDVLHALEKIGKGMARLQTLNCCAGISAIKTRSGDTVE